MSSFAVSDPGYYAACNTGDAEAVAACFAPGAVHYVLPGTGLITEVRAPSH